MHESGHKTRRNAIAIGAGLSGLLLSEAAASQTNGADLEAAALIDRFYAAYAGQDLQTIEGLVAEDIDFHDPTFHLRAASREELMTLARGVMGLQNIAFERFNTIVKAPWVVTQQWMRAESLDESGVLRRLNVEGAAIFQVRSGKIALWYDYYDVTEARRQMSWQAPDTQPGP